MSKKLFDFLIGNPPYMETRETTKDMPVYDLFMDASYDVADKVELITPGRFLFNAGATSKAWNQKCLNDPHFKVLKYWQNSSNVFHNTLINGGIGVCQAGCRMKFLSSISLYIFPNFQSIFYMNLL